MAMRFLDADVSELCLGKPAHTCVAASATVSDALAALRSSGDSHVSVWVCGGEGSGAGAGACACVGKFCTADAILFLCREENLEDPFKALQSPVSDLLPGGTPIVRHLQPDASLMDALDYMLEGAQNLVIPIHNHLHATATRPKFPSRHLPPLACTHHRQYCWLTQEDMVRFLLNSIQAFSPTPTFKIDSLNIIDRDIMTMTYNEPASSALACFHRALAEHTSIAVVDEENQLVGEISHTALSWSDETAVGAIMALSAMDLMTYMKFPRPPEDLVHLVKKRLEKKGLAGIAEFMYEHLYPSLSSSSSFSSSSSSSSSGFSSDEECGPRRGIRPRRSRSSRRSEAVACGPQSSLVAVIIQALAHNVSSVWVVDGDCGVVGKVTLVGILRVFVGAARGRHDDNLGKKLREDFDFFDPFVCCSL